MDCVCSIILKTIWLYLVQKQGLKNGDIVTEVEGENVKLHSCSQVTELIQTCVSRQKKDHEDKNQNIKIIEVENELDSTPFSVCIKVVTLYGSMIPQVRDFLFYCLLCGLILLCV